MRPEPESRRMGQMVERGTWSIFHDRSGWWSLAILVGFLGLISVSVGFGGLSLVLSLIALALLSVWAFAPPRPGKLLLLAVVIYVGRTVILAQFWEPFTVPSFAFQMAVFISWLAVIVLVSGAIIFWIVRGIRRARVARVS